MNAKVLAFVICVEVIIHLLLYNLHACTFRKIKEIKNNMSDIICFQAKVFQWCLHTSLTLFYKIIPGL